jgi:hypothetical protein
VAHLALLKDWRAHEITEALFQGRGIRWEVDEPNIIEATDVELRHEIGPGKPVFVRQRHVEAGICAGAFHIRRPQ